MSEFKEVWYVWDGDTETREMSFAQYVKGILFGDGGIIHEEDIFFYRDPSKIHTIWGYWGKLDNTIVAYTLGQKRRRVECGACDGAESWDKTIGAEVCSECKGTGKVWEYAE